MKLAPTETYGWQARMSGLALAGLALTACAGQSERSSQDSQESQSAPPAETQTTTQPERNATPSPFVSNVPEINTCTAIQIPVFPGSRFNQQNADSIQKQLDALAIAKTPGAEVGVRTLFNANVIVANALADNLYATALSSVAALPAAETPPADTLLATEIPGVDQTCLTKEQLDQVDLLSQVLVDGLGRQVGRQLSSAGQVAYDTLRENYQQFKERYADELSTR